MQDEHAQPMYRHLIRRAAGMCVLIHLGFIVLFAWTGVWVLAAVNVLSVLTHLYAYWMAHSQRYLLISAHVLAAEVVAHAVIATIIIGGDSGFYFLLLPMVPSAMLSTVNGKVSRYAISFGIAGTYLGLSVWTHEFPPFFQLPQALENALLYMNVITVLLFFTSLSARYHGVVTRAQEVLVMQASTDPLTGAMNRRRLMDVANAQLDRTDPTGLHTALLLCDIDHFKQVNDRLGHEAGDQALKVFYQRILSVTREQDAVCRWGGEEFLILQPATKLASAVALAERIRHAVADRAFVLEDGVKLSITVTIGVAMVQPPEELQTAVARADAAMYKGKKLGRNRVLDGETPEGPALPNGHRTDHKAGHAADHGVYGNSHTDQPPAA